MSYPRSIKVLLHLQRIINARSEVIGLGLYELKVLALGLFSQGARVSFGLWILKVKGPTLNLHILNTEVVLIRVWDASF